MHHPHDSGIISNADDAVYQAEGERAQAEERLRIALQAADLGTWDLDLTTDQSSVRSLRHDQIFGYEQAQAEWGQKIALRHVVEEDRPIFLQAFSRAAETGSLSLEVRVRWPDGSLHLIEAIGRTYYDGLGKPLRMVGVVADITERKQTEALRKSEAQFRSVFEQSAIGMGRVRFADAHWLDVNEAFCRMVGRSRKELLDTPWPEITHPEDVDLDLVLFRRMAQGELESYTNEKRFLHAHGHAVWTKLTLSLVRDSDGKPDYELAVMENVSERKLAEERLYDLNANLEKRVAERTAERNLLATLVETTDVMIMAADLHYNILAINAASADEFERVYRVRPKSGDNILELLANQAEHQAQVRAAWGRGLQGEHLTFVEDFGDPHRVRPYYEVKFRPLKDELGRVMGAYQFVTDVTDRLRSEAQLSQTREALRQSQKMEAIGQLTGGVAHDFNNLLAPIVTTLDVLKRTGLGGEREQRLIAAAARSAERARIVVQRLLAFARRQPLQTTPVDVAKLVTGMGDLATSTVGPNIKVVVDVQDGLPAAVADPNQLEMALLNLAVNARDAMPEGGTLRISARQESVGGDHPSKLAAGGYVCLSVTDTGTGMDAETVTRAAEPFFSTKGVGKGTGLGLSMVHGLVSQLGGALTIESAPGAGAKIDLWLPQTSASPPECTDTPEPAPVTIENKTVLLVEDDELVRMSTLDMLLDLGYTVVAAASAEEALTLVANGQAFDLLVTDQLMPGMTGTELTRTLRAARPDVLALLVSGYAAPDGIEQGMARLTKPFLKDELAVSLAKLAQKAP